MTLKNTLAALAVSAAALPAGADTLVQKASPHSVAETVDRLEAAVKGAGATVFARVSHSGGAAKIGTEIPDSELLIFGNPALGTPAMIAAPNAGLDLPLRVLVHETPTGVEVLYRAPSQMAETHGIPGDAEVIKKMTGALNALTGKAIATE